MFILYDLKILNGALEHLAIVSNPRYENAYIVVNAMYRNEFIENKHPKDTKEEFTEIGNSSFYNQQDKTIELKGDELCSFDNEIRENTLKYYKKLSRQKI